MKRVDRRPCVLALSAGLAIVVYASVCSSTLLAQPANRINIVAGGIAIQSGPSEPRGTFLANRALTRQFERATEVLEEGDYGTAIPLLQQIIDVLDREEDAFFNPNPRQPSQYLSLKGEAERRIGSLPKSGRKAYELRYGPRARQLADAARARDDVAALEAVVRRFFFTQAGHEAADLLGNLLMDRGDPLLAAFHFERLRESPRKEYLNEPYLSLKTAVCWQRAGISELAERVLWELRRNQADRKIVVGGVAIPLFERRGEALEWLEELGVTMAEDHLVAGDWNMFLGDSARNRGSAPVSPLWRGGWSRRALALYEHQDSEQETAQLHNQIESRLRDLEQGMFRDLITLPATHPLVVRDKVIFRTLGTLTAVDLHSGELCWPALAPDVALQHLLEGRPQSGPAAALLVDTFLSQRAWRDLTAGTMSSDGRYVFAIDDLGTASRVVGSVGPHPLAPQEFNTLKSFEVDTGRLAWQIGGEPGRIELPMAGHFFLGPPLPLGECLFCLAESAGEIRLVCLKVATAEGSVPPWPRPKVLWTQSLVLPEASVAQTPLRRQSGISPSYHDGVLICPTTAGAVVGFDPKTRQLMWGYRYQQNQTGGLNSARAIAFARARPTLPQTVREDEDRWTHSAVTLAHGRVLLTPRDSQDLHCLDAATGELLWRRPRGQGLYLATVYDRQVIVVGRSHVEAFRLHDGTPAWSRPAETGMPAGQGIRVNSRYHLPLHDNTLLTLDLQDGRILAESRLRGHRLGNLVENDGVLVAQSATELVGFPTIRALRQDIQSELITDLTDVDALLARAELNLHNGSEEEGLGDLRQVVLLADQQRAEAKTTLAERQKAARDAQESDPKPSDAEAAQAQRRQAAERIEHLQLLSRRAQGLIRLTLEQGLLTDFERYEPHLPELRQLITPEDEFQYHRILSCGLHESGRVLEAFDEYLLLLGTAEGDQGLIQLDGARRVRVDRWLEPRIRQLYDSATAEEHLQMQMTLNDEIDRALSFDRTEALSVLADSFQVFPAAVRARQLLIQRLDPDTQLGEIAYQLERLRESAERGAAAAATAQLARLYLEHDRAPLARPLIAELEDVWRDVDAQPGRTGQEVASALKSHPEYRQADTTGFPWPQAPLTASDSYNASPPRTRQVLDVRQTTGSSSGWTYRLDSTLRHLLALDGFGRISWQIPIATGGARPVMITVRNEDSAAYILEHDHLIVAVLNNRFLVLETLGSGSTPRVLWRGEVGAASGSTNFVMQRAGGLRVANLDSTGQPMGSVGLVNESCLVYQNGNRVIAAETRTGQILWEHTLMPRGCLLFGDDRHLLINPPDSTQVQVIRLQDGTFLETVELPELDRRIAIEGTHVLSWNADGARGIIQMQDAVTGEQVWSHEFPTTASFTTMPGREVAVLQRDGQFEVLDATTGETRLRSQLEACENLSNLLVKPTRGQYLVIANEPVENRRHFGMVLPAIQRAETVNGTVYAVDDGVGAVRWKRRIEDQEIDLQQPGDIPIVVFAVSRYQVHQPGAPRTQGSVLILDTRSGEIVFNEPAPTSSVLYDIQAETEPPAISVLVNRKAVRLEFGKPPENSEDE